MFPPEVFGVGVTVAELRPTAWDDALLPAGVVSRPSRLGDLLPVHLMTPEQKAMHLQRVVEAEAVLAAFKAELIVGLATDRPASEDRQRGQTGAASGEWVAELLDADVSEFFPDELALILNSSRAAATQLWERPTTLLRRLPATWAALADGWLDWPRARAIALELGWPAHESPDDVLAAVEAVVLPQATALSITRLRVLVRGELIKADPAAADRRRKKAERDADVTVRGIGSGMSEVRAAMPTPEAAEVAVRVDADARALKKAGDERPIGQLRSEVLHGLVTRSWEQRPGGSAHVEVVACLDTSESAAAGAPGMGREPVRVDGEPVTAVQARELLERLDALCRAGCRRRPTARSPSRSPTRTGDCSPPSPAASWKPPSGAGRGSARRRRLTGTSPPLHSSGSGAPGMAPAGTPAAPTAPAGPTSTTLSHTPRAARPTAPTCAACVAGTTLAAGAT